MPVFLTKTSRREWIEDRITYHVEHHATFGKLFQEYHMDIDRARNNMPHRNPTLPMSMTLQPPSPSGVKQKAGDGGASSISLPAQEGGGGASYGRFPDMTARARQRRETDSRARPELVAGKKRSIPSSSPTTQMHRPAHPPRGHATPRLVVKPRRMRRRRACAGMNSPRQVPVCANATGIRAWSKRPGAFYAQNATLLSTPSACSNWARLGPLSARAKKQE